MSFMPLPQPVFDFLKKSPKNFKHCTFLAGDASFRKYYRAVEQGGTSFVVMHAPPPEDPRPFIKIGKTLESLGFCVPHVFEQDLENGYLLLQDFGDDLLSKVLKTTSNETIYYEELTDLLTTLCQKSQTIKGVCPYTVEDFLKEAMVFVEWYACDTLEKDALDVFSKAYKDICETLLNKTVNTIPHCLILRDFHIDNILIQPNATGLEKYGLLDFQDAKVGPCVYDFVSLIQDARKDVAKDLQKQLWKKYLSFFQPSLHESLYQTGILLSALRHLKIIGVFKRIQKRLNKDHYLAHLPRVFSYLEDCLKEPPLKELNTILKDNMFL